METRMFQTIVIVIGVIVVMVVWGLTIYNTYYNNVKFPPYISTCPAYFNPIDISCQLDISTVNVNNIETSFNDISNCKPPKYQHSYDHLINHKNKCLSYTYITTDTSCNNYDLLSWKGILDYEHADVCETTVSKVPA